MKRPTKNSGVPWLGDVPAEWTIDKIKYWFAATNTRGNSVLQLLAATQKYGMYPQERLEGVVQVAEKTDLNTFKTVHVDDFVISLRSFQGGLERSDFEGVCSPAYQTFHATKEIDTGFFKHLFKSSGFIQAINLLTVGIREGKSINYSDVRNLCIPIPPLPEQRRIAAFLDGVVAKIDGIRDGIQREIERLGDFKKSLVAETVCRGVRGTNRALKPSGVPWLGDVPAEWEIVRNKTFMKLTSEKVGERKNDFPLLSLSKQGVIVRDVSEGKGKFPKDFDTYLVVKPDNLVFCLFDMAETPRTVGLVKNVGMLTGAYTNFEIDEEKVVPAFAYYYYLAVDDAKRLEPYYTGLRKIVKTDTFLSLRFPRPTIPEQREIVAYLDKATAQIDAAVEARKGQLEKLDALKKTAIAEYTTGKKEVLS